MKMIERRARVKRFFTDVSIYTPFTKMIVLLVVLWLAFAAGIYQAELGAEGSAIDSYGEALYWGVAAFSTAGMADIPTTGLATLIGGIWIVVGSALFFGAIVATITGYFMRPMQRPHKRIIDTIEYNLEQLHDLNPDELDLLKETVTALIANVESLKKKQSGEEEQGES